MKTFSLLSVLCLALVFTALVGCGEGDAVANSDAAKSEDAYTWEEWVEREQPKRPDDPSTHAYHIGMGLPDMSRWQPADILADQYLSEDHKDICGLPKGERNKVFSMLRDVGNSSTTLAEKRRYAERGFPMAQAALGSYCFQRRIDHRLESGQMTVEQSLEWARRGAASGHPAAMHQLGSCMLSIERHDELPFEEMGSFWVDEAHYWIWRAATEGLYPEALKMIRPNRGRVLYDYPTEQENRIHSYKWTRLLELRLIFDGVPDILGQDLFAEEVDVDAYRAKLSESELQNAKQLIGAWLRQHRNVWNDVYGRAHNPTWSNVLCPGDPKYAESYNYKALNEELEEYDFQVDSPF